MGRIALPPGQKRSRQIIAKVTEKEHAKVIRDAKRNKMTMSEYLRANALGLK